MKRTRTSVLAAAALAALFISASTTPSVADTGKSPHAPGHYIVVLTSDPVATYQGGVKGLKATKPAKGQQLDANAPDAQAYAKHLAAVQSDLLTRVGVTPDYTYQTALSGFSATLTAEQLSQLQASSEVAGVYPDELAHPTETDGPTPAPDGAVTKTTSDAEDKTKTKDKTTSTDKPKPKPKTKTKEKHKPTPTPAPASLASPNSTEFLGLGSDDHGTGGVWDELGGVDNAGEGVVIGILDSGITPENPSFAGAPLKTGKPKAPGTKFTGKEPYTDGKTIYYDKSDGGQFHADMVDGDGWSTSDYSTKLIGAQYFLDGAKANGADVKAEGDFLSPRDNKGHGTHVASTAAGDFHVPVTIDGHDYGTISGVAPAAKIAVYKPCHYDDTGKGDCATSDHVAAIDKAVADGVDVINTSLGGAPPASVHNPIDEAYRNAAEAGVFVALAAGNEGPGASTSDNAAPWYTTTAASTYTPREGTVTFTGFAAAGVSVVLPAGQTVSGPSIYGGDAASTSASSADCQKGTLDPAKVTGHIVVCTNGEGSLLAASSAVKDAGGIGMVLVNLPDGDQLTKADMYAVPTVHLASTYRDSVVDYVRGGTDRPLTLTGGNTTGHPTPTPQVTLFSSRGPILADGGDVLKPEITAPGADVLAAYLNDAQGAPAFAFDSGTSMASPQIAGLGALYLGAHPHATPAEIKSAIMTTAHDTLTSDGSANTDPFEQGAGEVDPTRYLHPGLLYLNGPDDWTAFLKGKGLDDSDAVDAIDGSDLNLPSISIGALAGTQTVTRRVTSTEAGTFTATADVAGVDVKVEPSTLTFDAPGETTSFTVTFTTDGAPLHEWATGFLTWADTSATVRSPIALFPVASDAPAVVTAKGTTGSTTVDVASGIDGQIPLGVSGLAPYRVQIDPDHPVAGHSGDESSGGEERTVTFALTVPDGATLLQLDLDSSDDEGSQFVLGALRLGEDGKLAEQWRSENGGADQKLTIVSPKAGTYAVAVKLKKTSGPMTWDLSTAVVTPEGAGEFTATPDPITAVKGESASYTLSWSGLEPGGRYAGYVTYGDEKQGTLVNVDTQ